MARIRAKQSCDACKNRKTKCVQTGTGPCRYCASTGGTCSTSARPQRRPYYRVSEEEYRCCMRLLRHFVPDVELDLKTMKAMIAEIEQGVEITSMASTTPGGIETEESEVLQEELGCMILDARGSYRYVGADSYVRFANAVAQAATAIRRRHRHETDAAVMVPLVRSRLPPATPESILTEQPTPRMDMDRDRDRDGDRIYLPPRDVCQRYAMRFFDEIQSIYWFYSPEQFYTLVDRTYADHGGLESSSSSSSASWLCSLYCIFAICSAREQEDAAGGCGADDDEKTSSEYLAMAKSMGLRVCDEADTDAVRALSLMSLALHSSCFTVTAYLITGMAVRMAYSLGLHRNIPLSKNQDSVSRARVHRLWWTLYLLDHEVAVQLGYPCAIVDHMAGVQTPAACESVLDPGRPTPHGYQAACVALIRLKKDISHTLYVAPALSARRVVPFSAVAARLADLRDWLAKLPPHLCWSSGTAPAQCRAVAVLHLRYWTALIYVQRPFLLYTATRGARGGRGADEVLSGEKRRRYEELSGTCLDAARKAVGIVKRMRHHGLLSSLVLFDSQCIQELVSVFLLAKQLYAGLDRPDAVAAASEGLETCMATMRGMEAVGWCEKMLPELAAQVAALEVDCCGEGGGAEAEATTVQEGGSNDGRAADEDREEVRTPWTADGAPSFQPVDEEGLIDEAFFGNFQEPTTNFEGFDMLDLDMGSFGMQEGMYHY
ncbi:putative Zn(II)2Cys6 transcription factor [Chaetomidium leptoderma]|uniref:Zn(II)2Cys6 transcription factor n=1 Tax=Chaetomidium leptoderma TaxID=669021 RepID=A0AAN6VRB5_9PEZI|nr:putative Zn(II)2Cys6 transcription factor [Chaetomidium leptoderma]